MKKTKTTPKPADQTQEGEVLMRDGPPGSNDYKLAPGVESAWVQVKKLVVHIVPTDEGVVVDIYTAGREDHEAIATTYAFDDEGDDDAADERKHVEGT